MNSRAVRLSLSPSALKRRRLGQRSPRASPHASPPRYAPLSPGSCHPSQQFYSGSIQNYSLRDVIGRGAFAVVREAFHVPSKERCALKTYNKVALLEQSKRKNLIREIKILKKLSHPHIAKFREAINDAQAVHIAMELADGESLTSYAAKFPRNVLPEHEARRIFSQVVTAVKYCHSQSVSHRDLKPDNVLLDRNHSVKLVDFGFATWSPSHKPVQVFCGTPSYMAPEIVLKKDYRGPPADVWALGALLFRMLKGRSLFRGASSADVYKKIARFRGKFPANTLAEKLVARLLRVEPSQRPTCDQILKDPWLTAAAADENELDAKVLKLMGTIGHSVSEVKAALRESNSAVAVLYKQLSEERENLRSATNVGALD